MALLKPSKITETYRLDLDGHRSVKGETGPLYATVDIERSPPRVDVNVRIVGHAGLYQRGIGVRRTLQISSFGEVQGNGIKIPAGYFEVHTELKKHGLGTIMMNAMLSWAHDYHPESEILPIGVTRASYDSDNSPAPFYARFGFLWIANSDANKHYSYPRPVATTCPLVISYPTRVPSIPEQPDPWRN